MISIKFSHDYNKLPFDWEEKQWWLISVCEVDIGKLPAKFLDYDTAYRTDDSGVFSYYQLPDKGKHLVLLLFDGDDNLLSTTIRRSTVEKKRYYEAEIGKEVKLEKAEVVKE